MKKIDNFTNLYSVSKTLRFKAIPIGKTQENINIKRILTSDEERAEKYKAAKKIIDKYHIEFIDRVLSNVELNNLDEYFTLFEKANKTDSEKTEMLKLEANMRSQISKSFKNDSEYKTILGKEIIKNILPQYLKDEESKTLIAEFSEFTTAFSGFFDNRANLYTDEEKSTAIAYRCINENLPRFISNCFSFAKIRDALGGEILQKINREIDQEPYTVEDCFSRDFFNLVLSGKGIQLYNTFLGGYTNENGDKIQGLNEYINLYNQQLGNDEKGNKLPKLKILYKQLLAEDESISFSVDEYKNDDEVLNAIKNMADDSSDISKECNKAALLFGRIEEYDIDGIYVKNGISLTSVSQDLSGSWGSVWENWKNEYDSINNGTIKNYEKYEEKRNKIYKSIESFSLYEIGRLCSLQDRIGEYCSQTINEKLNAVNIAKEKLFDNLNNANSNQRLIKDGLRIEIIKEYLDSVKELQSFLKQFKGTGKEENADELFYGEYIEILDGLKSFDFIYDKVRNYVTKKPYSTDKFKLYFQNPQFLGGWDRNKIADYRSTMLRKNGMYYLLVIDKENSNILSKITEANTEDDYYEMMDYKLVPGASKQLPHIFFSEKGKEKYHPSEEVLRIYEQKSFIKSNGNFNIDDCRKLIDYYKTAICSHEMNSDFGFRFSETSTYEDISGFYREVDQQGYKIGFVKVNAKEIDALVDSGKLYLFQLYNKDFSSYSHGRENLHTMYFKQIFNDNSNSSIKLCGGAEMFFRKASIGTNERIIHPAKQELKNKNELNPKKTSYFEYDLIKDKRYTVDQFEIHIPITLNRTPKVQFNLNEAVRKSLKNDENPYVIGIDRGERNLLYVCVIDGQGTIVEQFSLNEIINSYNNVKVKTDYHKLLDDKEKKRLQARHEWTTVENIKELKAGYISQVINKICELVVKYDAVIAMEDLNSGFKNSRVKVEKQVYQKFEKALIDKLNYMAIKDKAIGDCGSVINGYQLANPFESFRKMGIQNGFIFYIPAWLTSKIDPTTGFVNLINPKYKSVEDSKELVKHFESIRFNKSEEIFEFALDYSMFGRGEADYKKKWIVCSNGQRIENYRNEKKNGLWDNRTVDLTQELLTLFSEYKIDYLEQDIIPQMLLINEKDFWKRMIYLLKLVLQLRNSITGEDVDYLISPVKNASGNFYDSRKAAPDLPCDADANGAYNIARKVLWAIEKFKQSPDDSLKKVKISISNREWLEYAQTRIK